MVGGRVLLEGVDVPRLRAGTPLDEVLPVGALDPEEIVPAAAKLGAPTEEHSISPALEALVREVMGEDCLLLGCDEWAYLTMGSSSTGSAGPAASSALAPPSIGARRWMSRMASTWAQ